MTEYSVFGSGAPPMSPSTFTDGTPTIDVANVFYTYGATPVVVRCSGGRVYAPASWVGRTLKISAWHVNADSGLFTFTPSGTADVVVGAAGWVEARWTPFAVTTITALVVGYRVTDLPGNYLYVDGATYISGIDSVSDATINLKWAEINPQGSGVAGNYTNRSLYRIGTANAQNASAGTGPWYGIDVLMDDGTASGPSIPHVKADYVAGDQVTATRMNDLATSINALIAL